VPLHEELAFLDLYLELMRARFGERLRVEVEAGDEVRSARVPHLLLQPLVENAIRHGAAEEGAAWITVRARREGGVLALEVRDRGPGVAGPPEALLGRGIGLSNTAERLRHLYGAAGRLGLANAEGGGLRVTATLPFREVAAEVGA
jgi:LytS/YehU family sensor histidine kinase